MPIFCAALAAFLFPARPLTRTPAAGPVLAGAIKTAVDSARYYLGHIDSMRGTGVFSSITLERQRDGCPSLAGRAPEVVAVVSGDAPSSMAPATAAEDWAPAREPDGS